MSLSLLFIQKHKPGMVYGQRHFFISRSGDDLGLPYATPGDGKNLLVVLTFTDVDHDMYASLSYSLYHIRYWEPRLRDRKIRRLEIEDLEHIFVSDYYNSYEFSEYKAFQKFYRIKHCLSSRTFYKIVWGRFKAKCLEAPKKMFNLK